VLEGVLIDEVIEVWFECAGDFAWATGARAIQQTLGPLIGKALHPFAEGRIGKMAGRGDTIDMVTSDHRMDGLCTAKDTRLLGLLEHGFSGRERMIGKVAFEGAHRLAPWGRMTFVSYVTHGDPRLIGASWLRLKFSRFCL
jgi:hypothetical protein